MKFPYLLSILVGILAIGGVAAALIAGSSGPDALADGKSNDKGHSACQDLPSHGQLTAALSGAIGGNGGLSNHMWATVVNSDGVVCQVAKSGDDNNDQWLGSRVISAQKANTANAFSLNADEGPLSAFPGLALSTANLFSAVQPGGSLFGLQLSNPVDTRAAYQSNANNYGDSKDPMVGSKIGGVNVFGGGLGLYDEDGVLVGAVGVSGDTSCADHNVAWRTRDALALDFVPVGLSGAGFDNIIYDITPDGDGHPVSASGFGHPLCGFGEEVPAALLPTDFPVGP
jgi:uncharacterized protein GlcG (DUF336 family)